MKSRRSRIRSRVARRASPAAWPARRDLLTQVLDSGHSPDFRISSAQGGDLFQVCVLVHARGALGEKVALLAGSGSLTYAQLAGKALRLAGELKGSGLERDAKVHVICPDDLSFCVAFFGIIAAGCTAILSSPSTPLAELQRRSADCATAVAIVDERIAGGSGGATGSQIVVTAWGDVVNPRYEALDADMIETARHAYCIFTSGTTGQPKGIPRKPSDMLFSAEAYAGAVLGLGPADVVLSAVPLTSGYGLGSSLVFALAKAATTVIVPDCTADAVAAGIRAGTTVLFAHPRMVAALVDRETELLRTSSLRCVVTAGEHMPAAIATRWTAAVACPLVDGYGITEVGAICITNRLDDIADGSVGRPLDGYEIRIGAGTDGTGTLWIRCNNLAETYWATSEELRTDADGWFCTNDVFRIEDGRFYHLGRADDLLKVECGILLHPAELERAIMAHPAVADCAVTSELHTGGIVGVRALVVVATGSRATKHLAQEVRQMILAHPIGRKLNAEHCPSVAFVSELPRNAAGKLSRASLQPYSVSSFAPEC